MSFFFFFFFNCHCFSCVASSPARVTSKKNKKKHFQVRVVGVAVDHVCIRSASACRGEGGWLREGWGEGGEEAASQGHFQISLVGSSCGREAS